MLTITHVESREQIAAVQELFREYLPWAATFDLEDYTAPTFEGANEEIGILPGPYAAPRGRLLLALFDGQPAGCVALKPHDAVTGELKRFYVRPSFRGLGIGRRLVETLQEEARLIGYERIVLDSHIAMTSAHNIYQALGFRTIPTPADFPEALKPIVIFMECDLAQTG